MEDWKKELARLLENSKEVTKQRKVQEAQQKQKYTTFFINTVMPTFRDLKIELEKHGKRVEVSFEMESALIRVTEGEVEELNYIVVVGNEDDTADAVTSYINNKYEDAQVYKPFSIDASKEDIIQAFLEEYKLHVISDNE